ncbi:MAG: glycosyltransferase family 4 protein [Anaerolineae bacterium]
MRIAAISNSRIPSSTANSTQAMKMCEALVQTGHEVHLIIPAEADESPWEALAAQYGVQHKFPVLRLPSRPALKRMDFVWYAHAAARRLRAELIYTWLPQSAVFESWLGAPVVLEMHANVAGRFGPWWLREFWAGRRTRRLLVTTVALRRALERSTGIRFPDENIQIAPNGVDPEQYSGLRDAAVARAQLGLPERMSVGFTGHFYAGRGIELLFALAQALPTIQFLWVGGTPDRVDYWRRKVAQANALNVSIIGFVENSRVPLYQAAAEILLMPYGSRVEASSGQDIAEVINPMKMFEYMATGRAIVTADLPVIREILDESMAVFCPVDDMAAWKAAILDLSGDSQRRQTLGMNARQAAQKYTWTARATRAVDGLISS